MAALRLGSHMMNASSAKAHTPTCHQEPFHTFQNPLHLSVCALMKVAGSQDERFNTLIAAALQMLRKQIYLIAAVSRKMSASIH
eukprot:17404-Heterococcus_DN1.PRE.1